VGDRVPARARLAHRRPRPRARLGVRPVALRPLLLLRRQLLRNGSSPLGGAEE
jgi:hypothetical protein